MNHVVLSSWGAVFADLDQASLVDAAFNDVDLVPDLYSIRATSPLSVTPSEYRLLGQHTQKAMLAVEQAWSKAKLSQHRNSLRGKGDRSRNPRAAIVAGTSLGMISAVDYSQEKSGSKLSPYTMSRIRGNSIAAPIAIRFGLGAGDFSVSAASATGGQALWMAANLIRAGVADLVVVVCVDVLSPLTKRILAAVGASASNSSSLPLTAQRNGMRPIEAATAVILESLEHARQRHHRPLARWVNGAVRNDCYHLIAPEPSAIALREAVADTLQLVNCPLTAIDWLSMHSTGTRVWDVIEARLVAQLFAKNMPHISAFKRTFGHTLGAGCLLSIAMIAEGLAAQRLPLWPRNIDPAFKIKPPVTQRPYANIAMNWSAGMGGAVVVNLFERYYANS